MSAIRALRNCLLGDPERLTSGLWGARRESDISKTTWLKTRRRGGDKKDRSYDKQALYDERHPKRRESITCGTLLLYRCVESKAAF